LPILLDGRVLAREIQEEMAADLRLLPRPPGLGVILVGQDPASLVYVKRKAAAAARLGFHHVQVDLPENATEAEIIDGIERLNADPAIDGFLVQLPLPAGIRRDVVLDRVRPDKDVDGAHPWNTGLLALGRPRFVACTPAGIMRLFARFGVAVAGRSATVIGRSSIVGRPMSLLLDGANATVTVCHSRTADLEGCVRRADLLVVAIGRPHSIPGTWIKPGAAVVDVGMHRLPDGTLIGDVHPDGLEAAGWVTPVPGGVGPMTITMLLANTLDAARHATASSP
jgi:methylenetetrahydrofolate dehydrogenase (NADP+) / methenyltetrahydrofolate cyclohydrolase